MISLTHKPTIMLLRKFLLLTFSVFLNFITQSQDLIYKKSGETLKVKILEVGETEIKFKDFDIKEGSTFIILKSDIFKIKFENGNQEIYQISTNDTKDSIDLNSNKRIPKGEWNPSGSINDSLNLYAKGKADARKYYRNYNNSVTFSYLGGACLGPCGVIIPAVSSGISPLDNNLGFPDSKLFENLSYRQGYLDQASKMKERKVWGGYIGGVATMALSIGIAVTLIWLQGGL